MIQIGPCHSVFQAVIGARRAGPRFPVIRQDNTPRTFANEVLAGQPTMALGLAKPGDVANRGGGQGVSPTVPSPHDKGATTSDFRAGNRRDARASESTDRRAGEKRRIGRCWDKALNGAPCRDVDL